MIEKIKVAGFGGQGVLALGQIIANVSMKQDLHVAWIPSYGAEMRGGTANCSVIYSDHLVGSPILSNDITTLIVMNEPSLDKFEDLVVPNGNIIVNSSVVNRKVKRDDVNAYYVDATSIASDIGNIKVANMVILGSFVKVTNLAPEELIHSVFEEKFGGEKAKFIPMNIEAFAKGQAAIK